MEAEKDYQQLIGEVIQHIDVKAVETQRHFDDKAAEMKHYFDEKSVETQRHFDIVAENIKDKVKLLAEGLITTNKQVDKIKETVSIMQVDMAIIKTSVKITQNSIDTIKADTAFLKSDSMQKISREEFGDLKKRVILLENKFSHA